MNKDIQYIGVARNVNELEDAILLAANVFRSENGKTSRKIIEMKRDLLSPYKTLSKKDAVIIIAHSGKVCATCFIIDRVFYRGKSKLTGSYLSSICVSESYRGIGLSHLLMNAAISEVKKRKNAFALLIARKAVDHFYTKFHFWGLSQYSKIEVEVPKNHIQSEIEFLEPSPIDFQILNEIYTHTYKILYGAAERNLNYWKYIFWKSDIQKIKFRSIKRREEVIGYIIFSETQVFEFALRKGVSAIEVLTNLFSHSKITINASEKHPLFAELKKLDFTISTRECSYGGHMIRVIDFLKMKKCLEEELVVKFQDLSLKNCKSYFSASRAISVKINNAEVKCFVKGDKFNFEDTCLLMGAKYLSCNPDIKNLHSESFNIPLYDQI